MKTNNTQDSLYTPKESETNAPRVKVTKSQLSGLSIIAIILVVPVLLAIGAVAVFMSSRVTHENGGDFEERSAKLNEEIPVEAEEMTPDVTPFSVVSLGEVYDDEFVKVTIPKGWTKVLSEDDQKLVRLEKNDFYFYVSYAVVTGGGFGYPYDGVCTFTGTRKTNVTYKFGTRYDAYYDLSKDAVGEPSRYEGLPFKTDAGFCGIAPTIQNGKVVWLGSRFGTTETGTPATSYFEIESDASVELLVTYSHKNIEESNTFEGKTYAFPVFDSAEVQAMVTEMDAIAKTVQFKSAILEQ